MPPLREKLPVSNVKKLKHLGIDNYAQVPTHSRSRSYRSLFVGSIIVCSIVLMSVFATQISSDPNSIDVKHRFALPSFTHPFGTDQFGRDLWSRMIYGAQVSIQVSLSSVTLALLTGVPIGLTAGYIGKWVDDVIMRIMDALLVFPSIMLALLLRLVFGQGILGLTLAIAFVYVPVFARTARSSTLIEKEKLYVEAARALGQSNSGILVKHILHNISAPIFVLATTFIAGAIIIEASFSFLGIGVSIFEPSWGAILRDNSPYMQQYPHVVVIPGLMISLTIIGINLLSEGLQDILSTS
jgi:ABC-type dipeptide/oligopeptide/nickel transport system permease subunit